ncbi:anti-sigma B factor antagonist [Desulfocicer vacuolatum DSM 3385]|uniref:Anti-sigma factor antagonist n=1 Tax=Desulfocicer vacuolatum DSM 3385 TaxID=1121400 RepID=A0A1W2DNK3_9BACT|nr:STAS domain-containing protein [Desulfocicer vacuolatum]SMC99050.1 anti-sigma B factor antagonist [Desulfocicer vacuolatum DSM 3385]
MKIEKSNDNDVVIIRIESKMLDVPKISEFKDSVLPLIKKQKKVLFDLEGLFFVDSSGCGAILSCIRQVNADDGEIKICNINKRVRTLFELIRMHKIVEMYNTRQEAMENF